MTYDYRSETPVFREIPFLVQGPLGGSENGMIYSPAGAEFFLDFLRENFWGNIEMTLAQLGKLTTQQRGGIWSSLLNLSDELPLFSRDKNIQRITEKGEKYTHAIVQ